jgi:predicted PurR-regulated permease PerM
MRSIGDLFGQGAKLLQNLRRQAARLKEEERELRRAEKQIFLAAEASASSDQKVDLSTASVVRATLAIFGLLALAWFLLAISDKIILFFIAAFLAVAFDPFVDRLQSWRVPRSIGILLIYIIFIGGFGLVISSFVPILATEIPNIVNQTLGWLQSSFGIDTSLIREQLIQFQNYLASIQQNLSQENIKIGLDVLNTIGTNALAALRSVAGGVFSFGLVLVIAFFMVVEEDGIKQFLITLFPKKYHRYIVEKASAVENKFGGWLRGQIVLMVVVGVLTFLALKILGVHYAATLGTWAGLTELIPYVGPILAGIPALVIALSQGGWFLLVVVIALYIAIQQFEGNVIVPLVMKKAVGLSPVVIMFAMLVGASFGDYGLNQIVGIILSVPLATAISIFVQDYADKRK